MPVISYFNLNQIYILNTAFFSIIIVVGIYLLHLKLHVRLMTETDNVCNDPVAQFFNKKAAEKCFLDKTREETAWVEDKYDKNTALMNDKADEENRIILELTEKYNIRNGKSQVYAANNMYLKNKALVELRMTASNIKNMYAANEIGIASLYKDYSLALQDSITYLKTMADKISLRLTSNIYVKNYQNKRDSLSASYTDLGKRLQTMTTIGVADPSIENLIPLTYLQRYGKT